MTQSFYNTINASPEQANLFNHQCCNQETLILELFNKKKDDLLTPCDISAYFPKWPITSIRRAITNLTQDGKLVKTEVHRLGIYGKNNCCWMVAV